MPEANMLTRHGSKTARTDRRWQQHPAEGYLTFSMESIQVLHVPVTSGSPSTMPERLSSPPRTKCHQWVNSGGIPLVLNAISSIPKACTSRPGQSAMPPGASSIRTLASFSPHSISSSMFHSPSAPGRCPLPLKVSISHLLGSALSAPAFSVCLSLAVWVHQHRTARPSAPLCQRWPSGRLRFPRSSEDSGNREKRPVIRCA